VIGALSLPGIPDTCPLPGVGSSGPCSASGVIDSGWNALGDSLSSGFMQLMQTLMTFWISPKSGGEQTIVDTVRLSTGDLALVVGVISVMIAGTRIALASSRARETGTDLVRGLLLLVLISAGSETVIFAVKGVFDSAATTLITEAQAQHGPAGQSLVGVQGKGAVTVVIAIIGIVFAVAQYLILLFREPVLGVMAGLLPVAAAAAVTGVGLEWLKRLTGWIGSIVLYKYIAALIYLTAFTALNKADDLNSMLSAVALLLVAVAALPALMRLISPLTSALGTGGGGFTAAAGTVGMGAMLLSGRGGGASAAAAADGMAEAGTGTGSAGQTGLGSGSGLMLASGPQPRALGPSGDGSGAAGASIGGSPSGSPGGGSPGGGSPGGGSPGEGGSGTSGGAPGAGVPDGGPVGAPAGGGAVGVGSPSGEGGGSAVGVGAAPSSGSPSSSSSSLGPSSGVSDDAAAAPAGSSPSGSGLATDVAGWSVPGRPAGNGSAVPSGAGLAPGSGAEPAATGPSVRSSPLISPPDADGSMGYW
jgi:hypothetical protein